MLLRVAAPLRLFVRGRAEVEVAPGPTDTLGHVVESVGVPLPEVGTLVLDVHLGTLARRLRLLGVDTAWSRDADDDALVAQAAGNRLQEPVATDEVLPRLPAGTARTYDAFSRCRDCDGVSWAGAHARRLEQLVAAAQAPRERR